MLHVWKTHFQTLVKKNLLNFFPKFLRYHMCQGPNIPMQHKFFTANFSLPSLQEDSEAKSSAFLSFTSFWAFFLLKLVFRTRTRYPECQIAFTYFLQGSYRKIQSQNPLRSSLLRVSGHFFF